ncbi:TIGR03618 family F420-dependent PPOX class oxidoreductase [Actinomycetospora lemnae]|uniref:TIGR03618 family F420-dependent PPOX class oxidoreductase n=1 Tax=Actinomycetospora lemnae TaxID=3019891 RepID=A0ABT5SW96_9PSEU|nr:TIGR03618 family F420-dependent PPOX class oxidoreductase [Actinomycetospora sp. DW7H6]MDD7966996.1 TIGR03618 family F420-dependent PPOX class oxidoreductase [Actinomycetospora sp. DW7H6]
MADTRNGPGLHPMTEELATGRNFASVSTMLPSGRIQTQILWVGVKDGSVVVNTETHRRRFANVEADPRITVLIRDEQDPYRYAEVRGRVERTTTGPEARQHLDELAQRYTGNDYPEDAIKSERVILWVTPERQTIVDQNVDTSD